MIEISQVGKIFADTHEFAVRNISFHVKTGETLAILGSSGSGKTTLLKMINRLIVPSTGTIKIHDCDTKDIPLLKLRRSIGYVFQKIGLFPHMTVEENIAIALRLLNVARRERNKRAHELMEFVNLDPGKHAHKFPMELSGGEQQRVGVARALASKPEVFLMDEPFGAVDPITRDSLQKDFMDLKNKLNKTVIFVTHDVFEALRIADRIAIMDKGQLIQIGTKDEIMNHPANEFVHQLLTKPTQQAAERIEEYL